MLPPKNNNAQEPTGQIGFPKKVTAKFADASKKRRLAHFILPFSLLDLSKRDGNFQTATKAKVAAYLKLIEKYFPQASVEFLLGDTLRLENNLTQPPEAAQAQLDTLLKQWADFLNLPIMDLSSQTPTLQAQYTPQHSFEGFEPAPMPHAITLSSWRNAQGDENSSISQLMQRARGSFQQILKIESPNDILTSDLYLYMSNRLDFIKEHFAQAFSKILNRFPQEAETFKKSELFNEFIEGFGLTAAHHLKKVHSIDIDTAEVDTATQKKRNILSALSKKSTKQAAETDFASAYCYTLAETLVIFNVLAQQPDAQTKLTWMLYPSGIVDAPHYHPCLILNKILGLASFPGRFYTGSGFTLPQKTLNHPSSNGETQTMKDQTQPRAIALPPQAEQSHNGSPSSSHGTAGYPSQVSPRRRSLDGSDDEGTTGAYSTQPESGSSASSTSDNYDQLETEAARSALKNPKHLDLVLSLLEKAKGISAQEQRARSTSNAANAGTAAPVQFSSGQGSRTSRELSPDAPRTHDAAPTQPPVLPPRSGSPL